MTTTGGKITFGNNPATTYSVKQAFNFIGSNTNFGYATGDNVGGSYSPYSQQPSASINAVNAAGYGGVQQQRSTSPINQRGTVGQSLLNTYTSGQTVTPVTTSFENRPIAVSPQNNAAKITFGGKQFSSQFTPQTRYEPTTNYVAPVSQIPQSYQSYQNYQSYQRPVEIAPVIATQQIQSQPIREETKIDQQRYQPAIVSNKGSKVEATPIRESTTTTKSKKQKKGGCPAWLWPMLGILALLALILGLLFGLGVFGRIGGANIQKQQGQTSPTVVGANATTATTTPAVTPVDTTTIVATPTTTQQPGYTIMDETVVVGRNDTSATQGVTSPTTTTVDTTNAYTYTPTTTTYTPPVTTVDNTYTYTTNLPATTTTTEDDFSMNPFAFAPAPAPVATTSTTTGAYSTTDYNPVYTSTPYAAGTTYPTVSGYGSNPDFDFVQPTTSAQ